MVDLQIEQLGGQIGDGHEGRQRELFEKVFFTAAVPIENPTAAVSSSRLRTLGQIDRNGDGRLTKKEIKKGLALISQSTGVVQSARLIFDAMDGDGSDSIDVEEFCEFMSAAAASPAELFAKIDRNGATLPFLGLSLSCHCLSLAFHCLVTAFPWPSTVVSPPVTDFPHCL